MSPQTVNAYYNPAYNDCFPAAILQAPFNYQADEAELWRNRCRNRAQNIGDDDSGARLVR
jgi:hypothetical protein